MSHIYIYIAIIAETCLASGHLPITASMRYTFLPRVVLSVCVGVVCVSAYSVFLCECVRVYVRVCMRACVYVCAYVRR